MPQAGNYKKLRDFFKRGLEPGVRLWLVVVFSIVCIVFYVLGKAVGDFKGTFWYWTLAALGEIGGVGAAAVISGVILKILAMQGFFISALAEIVLSDQALEHLEPSRRQFLWQRLTQRIYMPSLWTELEKTHPDPQLTILRDKLSEAVSKRFSYDKRAYIKTMKLVFTIEWNDPSTKTEIVKKERLRFTQIPFVPSLASEWQCVRTAEAHVGLGGYQRVIKTLTINGEPPPQPVVTTLPQTPHKETLTYALKGAQEYSIVEEEHVTWNLDADPSWIRNLSLVAEKVEIEIHNKAEGLMIVVLDVGGDDCFEVVEGAKDGVMFEQHSVRESRGVVLPDQGLQLIFIRTHR